MHSETPLSPEVWERIPPEVQVYIRALEARVGALEETVQQLRQFAQGHPRGTVVAPYPDLGDQISLGAWVTGDDPSEGTAYLAKCPSFDEAAFSAFFDAYQFKGPERFPPDTLLPGRS